MNFRGGGAPASNAPAGFWRNLLKDFKGFPSFNYLRQLISVTKKRRSHCGGLAQNNPDGNSFLFRNPLSKFPFDLNLIPERSGFTMAEVLITLGIIGIVAAMTLPSLIQRNNNKVVETRLKKFYSAMNQAILMSENVNGDKKDWFSDVTNTTQKDEEGNFIKGSNPAEVWFNYYLAPYLNIIDKETLPDGSYIVYFADGGALEAASHTTRDWYFYPGKPKKCIEKYGAALGAGVGICVFVFNFYPNNNANKWTHHYNKGMEPYKYNWDGNIQSLYNGMEYSCNSTNSRKDYCTAIIQMNNWTIPTDYPFKVSY